MSGISRKIVSGARTAKMSEYRGRRWETWRECESGQINTWLNRPENSFHPSSVSYGAAPSAAAHRQRATRRVRSTSRFFSLRFRDRIGRITRPGKETVAPVECQKYQSVLKTPEFRWCNSFISAASSTQIRRICHISHQWMTLAQNVWKKKKKNK